MRLRARQLSWVLVSLAVASAAPTPYLTQVSAGLQRAEQGQWELALREFGEAAQADPDDALGYAGQGLCELAERQREAAAALFRRADETDRCDAVAALGLGLCYFETGRLTTAEVWFQRASQLDALMFAPYFYRAVISLCEGRLDPAADLLRRARELGAPDAVLDYLESMRLFASGRWQAAADGLRRLKPKLAMSIAGLPNSLPLLIDGQPGSEIRLTVPQGEGFSDRTAPRNTAVATTAAPAYMGPLTVESPVPGEVVSGQLPIRVNLRQPRSYKYVTISVDGQLKGMTNREPYYVVWDTTNYADGAHQIEVRAMGGTDAQVSFEVTVKNRVAARENPYDPVSYRAASRRLAGLMVHSHPAMSVEQLMVQAYQQQDPELAIDMYERVLARDASRVDVIEPLLKLYRGQALAYTAERIPEPMHGIAGGRRVALTFDDGPRPEYTAAILALLRRHRARATFLVTGRMSERYPELVRAIADDGHEVASHTYNHLHLDDLTRDEIIYELVKTKVVLDDAIGGSSRFFRPPGGHYSQKVREAVAAIGYFPVFWTINGGSYSRMAPAEAAEAITRRVADGAILLLHNGADNTLPMLPELLGSLASAGYRCVTVSDILRAPTDSTIVSGPAYGPLSSSTLQTYAGEE